MENKPNISLDKIRGMLMGVFLGDALGAPHEFKCNAGTRYTGILEHKGFTTSRFHGKRELCVGQVTDDSELTLVLLRTLIQDKKYNEDNVILAYLKWANSGSLMMGKNTRKLLCGVKTIKGYKNRVSKILATTGASQSNGAMMRCSPLALISDEKFIIDDVNLTNPDNVCIDCNLVYVAALKLALRGFDPIFIFNYIKNMAKTNEVKEVFKQVENRNIRNIVENKGWCLHALWCSMVVLTSFNNYSEAINWVITCQPGSDTDTNASISGGLLGAILGFEFMQKEHATNKNIEILLQTNPDNGQTPRPYEYTPKDFYFLTEAAQNLTKT